MKKIRFGKWGLVLFNRSISLRFALLLTLCFLMLHATAPAHAATLTVTSRTDSGPGSLRQTMLSAIPGDVLTFDPGVFPPTSPATITLLSGLPEISMDNLTIDASNAGVILDGRYTASGTSGLRITSSGNIIKGLQIINFPGDGIAISNGAKNNLIGGDWTVGSAPHGEGNIITLNGGDGVNINGTGTDNNTVSGNLIGLDVDGTHDIRIQAMAISPNYASDRTLFIGTKFNGVFKTTDGGDSWTEANSGLTIPDVRALAVSPNFADDGTLFAGTANGGIFKSRNGGGSWTRVDGGLTTRDVKVLAISPNYAVDGHVFAAVPGDGVLASTNGGTTWAENNSAGGSLAWTSLLISPNYAVDQTLFMFSYPTLYKSTNQGIDWTTVGGDALSNVTTMAISPNFAVDRTLVAGTGCGANSTLLKSIDAGSTWAPLGGDSGAGCQVGALGFSPNYGADQTIFGITPGNVFKYNGAGSTNLGVGGNSEGTLAISPAYSSDGTLFVGLLTKIFKSVNGGSTWTDTTAGLTERGNTIVGLRIQWGAQGNIIGGTTPGERNVISHNNGGGIAIHDGSNDNKISGNYIGTDATGMATLRNENQAISMWSGTQGNVIGGTTPGERNVISGNYGWGVWCDGGVNNIIAGNYIGLNATGTATLGNGSGIGFGNGAEQNRITGNVVSGNNSTGIDFNNSHRNVITGNYIGTDPTGTVGIGNTGTGVSFCCGAQDNVVGGTTPAERNIISGNNGEGVHFYNSHRNIIAGNYIGLNAAGTAALGNVSGGIGAWSGAEQNRIIGNIISGNGVAGGGGAGVAFGSAATMNNTVIGNYIGTDASGITA